LGEQLGAWSASAAIDFIMSLRSKPPMRLLASGLIPHLKHGARRHTDLAPPAGNYQYFAPHCFFGRQSRN